MRAVAALMLGGLAAQEVVSPSVSRGATAAAHVAHAPLPSTAEGSSSGGCACETAGGWDMLPGVFFKGTGKLYVTTTSDNMEQCRLACCYRQLGCSHFSFDGRAGTPETCTLWVSIEGNTPSPTPGYVSGKLTGPHCKAPAGVDPMHPRTSSFLLITLFARNLLAFCSMFAHFLPTFCSIFTPSAMRNTKLITVRSIACMQRSRWQYRGFSTSRC